MLTRTQRPGAATAIRAKAYGSMGALRVFLPRWAGAAPDEGTDNAAGARARQHGEAFRLARGPRHSAGPESAHRWPMASACQTHR